MWAWTGSCNDFMHTLFRSMLNKLDDAIPVCDVARIVESYVPYVCVHCTRIHTKPARRCERCKLNVCRMCSNHRLCYNCSALELHRGVPSTCFWKPPHRFDECITYCNICTASSTEPCATMVAIECGRSAFCDIHKDFVCRSNCSCPFVAAKRTPLFQIEYDLEQWTRDDVLQQVWNTYDEIFIPEGDTVTEMYHWLADHGVYGPSMWYVSDEHPFVAYRKDIVLRWPIDSRRFSRFSTGMCTIFSGTVDDDD